VDWALEREAWFVPERLAERFPAVYWEDELLVYRLAEAKLRQGDEAGAEQTAKHALGMNPNQQELHSEVANRLRYQRQMFAWAEAEFRQIIETAGESHRLELKTRERLAQMLGDLQREYDAAETLKPSLVIGERDPAALASAYEEIYGAAITPAELRAKIDHFLGIHYGQEGDTVKAKTFLEQALAVDTENIDIVIALYRVADDDEAWRKKVDKLLAAHVQRIDSRLKVLEQALKTRDDREIQTLVRQEFAQKNNEYAWLVGNTVGDYQKAVACSEKSLELDPDNWAFQDTLARCYYAVGDYKRAIHYQKLAVEQAPYLQQMRRQLKLFEDALAETALPAN
ncbi:MAG: tetratricopeptide repeat protein, partial [Pirellulaceae bacterium]